MSVVNVFLDTISGNVDNMSKQSKEYMEITREVYDLKIPTSSEDRVQLKQDRRKVVLDIKLSVGKYKKWQNSKENSKL